MNIFRYIKKSVYLTSVLAIVLGVVFLVNPVGASDLIAKALGAIVAIGGLIAVIIYFKNRNDGFLAAGNLCIGILLICVGIFLISYSGITLTLLGFVMSVYLIIDGLVGVDSAIAMARSKRKGWSWHLVFSVVILAAGIIFLFRPFGAIKMSAKLLGIVLLFDGVTGLITAIRTGRIVPKEQIIDGEAVEIGEDDGEV